jgi:hypothetical protein
MMKTFSTMTLIICLLSPVSETCAAEAGKSNLPAQFSVAGTNANGSKYTGVADIGAISDTTFSIVWHIGAATQKGFGMRMKDTLSATYMLNGEPGLIIDRAQGDGIFIGTWAIRGRSGLGTETLTPRN